MKQLLSVLFISLTSFFYTSLSAQSITAAVSPVPAKLISFKGSVNSNKVILQWAVSENQTADKFEVEKSADGHNFVMAALVFGTDSPETGNYEFLEKANNKKVSYRIKL